MATYDTTSKHGSRALTGANVGSDIDLGFKSLRDDIENKMAAYSEGPFGSRPTSTSGTPGKTGRIYRATDTGRYYIDNGTGWDEFVRYIEGTFASRPAAAAPGRFHRATDTGQVSLDTGSAWVELPRVLRGTKTWDPASVGPQSSLATDVTVTGAQPGQPAVVGFSAMLGLGTMTISAAVRQVDTVTVTLENHHASLSGDLGSGTLDVRVFP
jgi:hypothetical protein